MQKNLREIIRAFLIIFASIVLIKIIMSFKKEVSVNELTESKRLISTEVVKLGSNKISVPVYGKLSSKIEINIVTEANGIFYGNNFKSGTKVSQGDTLGYIKYDELESNLNSQKSNLLNQVSKIVSEMKFDFPESYNLWYNFMDEISFSKPLPQLPSIQNKKLKNFLSGKNFFNSYYNAKSTEDRLNKHILIAEFSGYLSQVTIKNGTAVVFGQMIGKLHDPSILEFESNTSIKNTLFLEKDMIASIKSDEFIGERIGKVSRINKILNPSSQNMSVFIETSDQGLYDGMYVFGEIIVGEIDNTFLIKRNLIEDNNVFVIIDNKLVSKKIDVIQIFEENAIIRGLSNNDRVLNEPIKGAFNGMAVRFNR